MWEASFAPGSVSLTPSLAKISTVAMCSSPGEQVKFHGSKSQKDMKGILGKALVKSMLPVCDC